MSELVWVEVEKAKFVASFQSGRAVIQQDPRVHNLYNARLELPSGEVVLETTLDLESAKHWAWANLPLLDQMDGKLRECGLILETLNRCQQTISLETDAIYWLWVEHIKQWIAHYSGQSYVPQQVTVAKDIPSEFHWIEKENQFYVDTLYGRCSITEVRNSRVVGGALRHEASVIHHTGAKLDCYAWLDFMEAESSIREHLNILLSPIIGEGTLNCVDFVLNICENLLLEDTDPIHASRLEALEMTIHLALD